MHPLTHDHYISLLACCTLRSCTACPLLPRSPFPSGHSSAHLVLLTQSVLTFTPLINDSAAHTLQWSLLLTDAALLQQLRDLVLHPPVDVTLVNWHRPEEVYFVRAVSVSDLRRRAAGSSGAAMSGADLVWPKLYVFASSPAAPRGATVRVKLTNDDTLVEALAGGSPRNTVYFFNQLDDSPESPPKDSRPRGVDGVDSPTRSESGASRASSTIRKEFQGLVQQRYIEDNLVPPTCFCCGTPQGMTTFEAAHIVPFFLNINDFLKVGLGSKSDPRNGVLMCLECHRLHDKGAWNFDEVTVVKKSKPPKLKLRIWVSDGLKDKSLEWASRHGTYVFCPKDFRWPYAGVWKGGWEHNAERTGKARGAKRDKKGRQCASCLQHFKVEADFKSHECKPNPLSTNFLISPDKAWPLRRANTPLNAPNSGAISFRQSPAQGSDSINCRFFNSTKGCRFRGPQCRHAHRCNTCGSAFHGQSSCRKS